MKHTYKRLSHSVWLCKYHIVFCPKYRFYVLEGKVEIKVRNELYKLCGMKDQIDIEEINIQSNHVHMILSVPPKYSISEIMGWLKGKVAIKLFQDTVVIPLEKQMAETHKSSDGKNWIRTSFVILRN